jgi:hypothetical protein
VVCRFYGFRLAVVPASEAVQVKARVSTYVAPVLVVVGGDELSGVSATQAIELREFAESFGAPVAVVGITTGCAPDVLSLFAGGATIRAVSASPGSSQWVCADNSAQTGFALRGIPFSLGGGGTYCLECMADPAVQVLTKVGLDEQKSAPGLVRIKRDGHTRFLAASVTLSDTDAGAPWSYDSARFGEIVTLFLLVRDVGGVRCWHSPGSLANLTIDDPWLIEPYGSLSFNGLLAEMERDRFHATIGFVPWNYDRSSKDVVELFRANPEFLSIAVHGNNHDRYEFYRYEARSGDNQRAKPLSIQAFNIRQALARMEVFHQRTGLDFDRIMVFPHGVCPAPTFRALKQHGFWATSKYSNVPLDETAPRDPAVALRATNTEWEGFPAMRRAYPWNYTDDAIAIDLFLGNPVLFMAHQEIFIPGIDAFNSHARRVNERQPTLRWTSLGEISRRLHLLRWLDDGHCEVRLISRHAKLENQKSAPAAFHVRKREGDAIDSVTIDGAPTAWTSADGEVRFDVTLRPFQSCLIELHYGFPAEDNSISVRRHGFRNRSLRLIADVRDRIFSRSALGRCLARSYYRDAKRRPTLSSLLARLRAFVRRLFPGSVRKPGPYGRRKSR